MSATWSKCKEDIDFFFFHMLSSSEKYRKFPITFVLDFLKCCVDKI